MKSRQLNKIPYIPLGHFLIRTPALPFSFLNNVHNLSDSDVLSKTFSNKTIAEAIYYASPSLFNEIQNSLSNSKTLKDRAHFSLTRYLERMAVRCTPFGLFATVSTGHIDNESQDSHLMIESAIIAHHRIDMIYAHEISRLIHNNSEFRSQVRFFPNNTIYQVGNTYRYIEPKYINGRFYYELSSTRASEYTSLIIEQAKDGVYINDLVQLLIEKDVEPLNAMEFVNKVVDSYLLLSESDITVVGDPYPKRIVPILEKMRPSQTRDSLLLSLSKVIRCDDFSPNILSARQPDTSIDADDGTKLLNYNNIIQVDAERRSINACLGRDMLDELSYVVGFFAKISKQKRFQSFEDFKRAFKNKYEQQAVSLEEALDPEIGIGYPISHGICDINGLTDLFKNPTAKKSKATVIDEIEKVVMKKMIHEGWPSHYSSEIILTEEDLNSLSKESGDLPQTIGILFQIIGNQNTDSIINLKAISTVPANVVSRFGHLGNDFHSLITEIVQEEDKVSEYINADIVYYPDIRMGNIICRPHTRKYEIPINMLSDYPSEQQILLSDLMLSYKEGRLVLYSKKLGKEVRPKQSNAHNYNIHATPIYQFLCDLQYQGIKLFDGLPVQTILDLYNRSPRIVFNKTILSPAMWSIEKNDFISCLSADEDIVNCFASWRAKKMIPPLVTFSQADQELLINFNSRDSIYAFLPIIKGLDLFVFKEFLFRPNHFVARDENGNGYTNEIFVSFSLQL